MMRHAGVPEALELVIDEVGKESQRIRNAGGEALKAGKLEPAKKAVEYAERFAAFVKKVCSLGDEWAVLQREIEGASREVQEIVLPTKIGKPHKTGFTRKVEKVSPRTNFTVTFQDGCTIADPKAKVVFAKTIEKLGAESVASLKIVVAGEPLLSRDKAIFKKEPTQIQPIIGGWYVKTHSSTAAKMQLLEKIAKVQKVKLRIQCENERAKII